jgi:DNA phosphorothioation-dependent restriction protein DptG
VFGFPNTKTFIRYTFRYKIFTVSETKKSGKMEKKIEMNFTQFNYIRKMTEQTIKQLEKKAKKGWRCYYLEQEKNNALLEKIKQLETEVHQLKTTHQFEHLKNMYLTLYEKVGELQECPICFQTMTKEITYVPSCAHLVCKACKESIDTCPICREKI